MGGKADEIFREHTHPELSVVIVTGYPDSELMKRVMQYAPLMLVAKPVEPELLERTVRTAVGEKMIPPRDVLDDRVGAINIEA